MKTTNTHTDTPFHVGQICGRLQAVYGQLGEQVADCSGFLPHEESNANADFIVRACNSHAGLVAALEGLLNAKTQQELNDSERQARAALHSAKE